MRALPLYDEITSILEAHGFSLENIQTDNDPSEALFIRPRAGLSVYVTVPLDCESLPDTVIQTIMTTAQIPAIHWRQLLKES